MVDSEMKESKTTTIRIYRDTKKLLDKLREHPRDTYDDIVSRIARIALREKLKKQKGGEL